jgi:hypothetical protein
VILQLKTFSLIRSPHSPGDIVSNAITRCLDVTYICCNACSMLLLSIMTKGDCTHSSTYNSTAPPAQPLHLFYWPSDEPAPPDAMGPCSDRRGHEQIFNSLIHLPRQNRVSPLTSHASKILMCSACSPHTEPWISWSSGNALVFNSWPGHLAILAGFSRHSSVPPGKWHQYYLNWPTTASFHSLSNSAFIPPFNAT